MYFVFFFQQLSILSKLLDAPNFVIKIVFAFVVLPGLKKQSPQFRNPLVNCGENISSFVKTVSNRGLTFPKIYRQISDHELEENHLSKCLIHLLTQHVFFVMYLSTIS
jgi:hypothetical protein